MTSNKGGGGKTIKDIIKGNTVAKTKDESWVKNIERRSPKDEPPPTGSGGSPQKARILEQEKNNPGKER
jgi:hypothetical protein